jgi:hypothetical protein
MGKLNVKDGTPVGSEHLCRSCINGQFTTGYRVSEVFVICTNVSPSRVVPFPVHECTDFHDRFRPSWDQMEKLALSFDETRRKATPGFRGNGFGRVPAIVDDGCEDQEQDDVALVR